MKYPAREMALLPVFVMLISSCGTGGSDGVPPPDPRWSRSELAYSVQQTTDGGYVVTGEVVTGEATSRRGDVFLLKTNSGGTVLWAKKFGGTGDDRARCVQQTGDGGYIVAGYTNPFGSGTTDVYLIKTDTDGNVRWERTFGVGKDDRAYSVIQISDGSYIITGLTGSIEGGDDLHLSGASDLYLLKVGSDGDKLWEKTVKDGDGSSLRGYQIVQTADGGYAIVGEWTDNKSYSQALLMKVNQDGDPVWQNKYGGLSSAYGWSVRQTSDGGFIIAGSHDGAYLVKTDSNGVLQWEKTFREARSAYALAIGITPDGGYIVAGGIRAGDPNADGQAYIFKTDPDGSLLWEKEFGLGTGGEEVRDVKVTSDNGYILAGWTGSYGYLGDVLLIKTDALGGSEQWLFVLDAIPLD